MKILVVTLPPWRDDKGDGNVLSNLFSGVDAEFAQIYCMAGMPDNQLCSRYLQMDDHMMISALRHHTCPVKTFTDEEVKGQSYAEQKKSEDKGFYQFFWKHKLELFYVFREWIWDLAPWKCDELTQFVKDFNPDIIYAPCYANVFMLKLARYLHAITDAPVFTCVYDDIYSLHQFRLDPVFWLRRFRIRHNIRKTMPVFSRIYTFTGEEKEFLEKHFGKEASILRKSGIPSTAHEELHSPLKLIYAGGIYLNRWKTLLLIRNAIAEINADGQKMILDIYTDNEVYDKEAAEKLNDGINSRLHAAVPMEQLRKLYSDSDIALHVESFDAKNRTAVRMSFSTKIVDCLESGCAVLAIADPKQAGISYLKEEDAAICVTDQKKIGNTLKKLASSAEMILEYQEKARACLIKNHSPEMTAAQLNKDLEAAVKS